jgi:DNA-directed RNA polymerase subunit RPC12/RpoP
MKEYGNHKTKSDEEEERWREYRIDKVGDYVCSVCKKTWVPDITDINTKRMTTYYKLCKACRMKSFLKGREYKGKKGNNYDKLRDSNNRTNEGVAQLEQ